MNICEEYVEKQIREKLLKWIIESGDEEIKLLYDRILSDTNSEAYDFVTKYNKSHKQRKCKSKRNVRMGGENNG